MIWQYQGGPLPKGVTVISEQDVLSGNISTVEQKLTWSKESTLDERRETGGLYTCTGTGAGEEIKQSVHISVQCKYILFYYFYPNCLCHS